MTSRQLLRWTSLHERRARRGWWTSRWTIAVVAGGAIAALVAWRAAAAGIAAASHAWLAAALAAFALAFLRVPFQLYWRPDAALLAQLPIAGSALLDVALVRCVRAAAATTAAVVLGAVPLALQPDELGLFARHAAVAGVLGLGAACLLPAVAIWAASLVATTGTRAIALAASLGGAPARTPAQPQAPGSAGAVLGALPGFASTVVFVVVLIETAWLTGGVPRLAPTAALGALAAASVLAIVTTRALAPRSMGTILRDVSALDRQRLATLEIRPPTAIERFVARQLGDAALPYRKDARLVRRRYPMAFALGALAFGVLVIVGLARPADPVPWLVATLGGATMYAIALGGRLHRPPIELPRLSATLPISAAARRRAKLAWIGGWWSVFVLAPALFAIVRVGSPVLAAVLGLATAIAVASAWRPAQTAGTQGAAAAGP